MKRYFSLSLLAAAGILAGTLQAVGPGFELVNKRRTGKTYGLLVDRTTHNVLIGKKLQEQYKGQPGIYVPHELNSSLTTSGRQSVVTGIDINNFAKDPKNKNSRYLLLIYDRNPGRINLVIGDKAGEGLEWIPSLSGEITPKGIDNKNVTTMGPVPLYAATFTPGKNIYVGWDGKNVVPQVAVKGLTAGGHPMEKVIIQKEIHPVVKVSKRSKKTSITSTSLQKSDAVLISSPLEKRATLIYIDTKSGEELPSTSSRIEASKACQQAIDDLNNELLIKKYMKEIDAL